MKTYRAGFLLCLVSLMIYLGGCSSLTNGTDVATKVQNVLTNILPPDYSGDVAVSELNPYFDIGFTATNVHRNANGLWTWDGIVYHRGDMFHTSGDIKLTPKPQPAPAVSK